MHLILSKSNVILPSYNSKCSRFTFNACVERQLRRDWSAAPSLSLNKLQAYIEQTHKPFLSYRTASGWPWSIALPNRWPLGSPFGKYLA